MQMLSVAYFLSFSVKCVCVWGGGGGGEPCPKTAYRSTDESFPRFLRTEFDERRLAEEESKHVRHHIVHHHHQDGQDEPDQRLKHVLQKKKILLWATKKHS